MSKHAPERRAFDVKAMRQDVGLTRRQLVKRSNGALTLRSVQRWESLTDNPSKRAASPMARAIIERVVADVKAEQASKGNGKEAGPQRRALPSEHAESSPTVVRAFGRASASHVAEDA